MDHNGYTALASTDEEVMAVDSDWHFLSPNEQQKDVTTLAEPLEEPHLKEESSTSSSQEMIATEDSTQHLDVATPVDDDTSEKPPTNDQQQQQPESWNSYLRKGAVAAVGGTMVGVGLIMIPLPTPFGAVVASSGLAVLGTEFEAAKEMNDTLIASTQEKLETVRFRMEEKLSKSDTPKFLSKAFLPLVKRKPPQIEETLIEIAANTESSSCIGIDQRISKDLQATASSGINEANDTSSSRESPPDA